MRQLVGEKGPLPFGEAARIFADVADGLAHVHERGLVHRDVKPANVMVRPDGRAVLLDLGLALAPGEPLPADPAIAGGRGYIVGTMDYLAPEQAQNAVDVGPAADLYGLGCSLFFALTGTLPFPAQGAKEKMRRHRNDPPPGIANVPPGLAHLVKWLMAKTPADRPGSAVRGARPAPARGRRAAEAPATVNVVAAADAAVLDADLWDATPGDELPFADPMTRSNPLAIADEVERGRPEEAAGRAPRPLDPTWLLLVLLLGGLMGLVVLRRRYSAGCDRLPAGWYDAPKSGARLMQNGEILQAAPDGTGACAPRAAGRTAGRVPVARVGRRIAPAMHAEVKYHSFHQHDGLRSSFPASARAPAATT